MMLNPTFNNISVISWWSDLLAEYQEKTPTCRKSLTSFITHWCIKYISQWARFELTMLVVMATNCIGSSKSNYQTNMTMMVPCHGKQEISKSWKSGILCLNSKRRLRSTTNSSMEILQLFYILKSVYLFFHFQETVYRKFKKKVTLRTNMWIRFYQHTVFLYLPIMLILDEYFHRSPRLRRHLAVSNLVV